MSFEIGEVGGEGARPSATYFLTRSTYSSLHHVAILEFMTAALPIPVGERVGK